MKEHPIIFKSEMVRAILDGRKIQTRRLIKPQPVYDFKHLKIGLGYPASEGNLYAGFYREGSSGMYVKCPFGQPGDRLWVRETWWHDPMDKPEHGDWIGYCTDAEDERADCVCRPSIHMPRWASRITLEITNVKVERIQDISGPDILKEGFGLDSVWNENFGTTPLDQFKGFWNFSYKDMHRWLSNPWVWVIDFKIEKGEIKR